MKKETRELAPFKKLLLRELPDVWFFKTNERNVAGIPDIIGCFRGGFFGLERKTLEGRATPLQLHTLGLIEKAGGVGMISTPANNDEVLARIRENVKRQKS